MSKWSGAGPCRLGALVLACSIAVLLSNPRCGRAQTQVETRASVPGPIRGICASIADVLAKLPDVKLRRSEGSFEDFVARHERFGCRLTASGHFHDLVRSKSPEESVFELLAGKGWRRDLRYDADGPDGTAFGMRRSGILCLVRGSWDGGDDSDPRYVPGDWYRITVGCAEDESVAK